MNSSGEIPSLESLERRADRISAKAVSRVDDWLATRAEIQKADQFLQLAPDAEKKMEELTTALFGKLLSELETNLTHAIREILGQDREVKAVASIRDKKLQVDFQILNQGGEEDIMVGQGGSVCNILSVGLRLIALSRLNPEAHRPFLVLDEQDCWLRPDLVPRFMELISTIAERLNFQVLVISHHPLDLFEGSAESILALEPNRDTGVKIVKVK
ncbi:MAG: ATPase involved in DNA repair-like protein [Desulfovibrio sp. S3730MH75]|nr:MAG: ATPase involved in DNA repair-like protein [Desulfovibrio sp. S3730MH75]